MRSVRSRAKCVRICGGEHLVAVSRTVSLSSPWLDEREEELVTEVLRSGRLSLGPTIDVAKPCEARASGANAVDTEAERAREI